MPPYQVIARKWRPQQFDDVIGQDHITQTLRNAIKNKRIAHAYLFVGPRGTGKTTTARIFAKALNCQHGPTTEPCDKCTNCLEIIAGNSMNVLEIDGASNRGIDEIRQLRDTVKYAPAGARFKIYIIDEVHMLTKEAFNALLKTLEEPPQHVKFFFATTEPEKVLPTILSRCQRFDLRRIPAASIVKHLASIAKSEKVKVSDEALFAIARGADGGMRDAQCALDQLISYCGSEIGEQDVLAMYGLTASNQIVSLVKAILEGNAPSTLTVLNEIAEAGKDLQRLLVDLIGHFRNLLLLRLGMENQEVLDLADTQMKELKELSATIDADAVLQIIELLGSAEARVRWSPAKKIVLEMTLLRAIKAREGVGVDALIKRLNELKRDLSGGSPIARANAAPAASKRESKTTISKMESHEEARPYSSPAAASTLPVAAPVPINPQAGTDLTSLWQELLRRIEVLSPFIQSHLADGRPLSFDGRVLKIVYAAEFAGHKALAASPRAIELLQAILKELGHNEVLVQFDLLSSAVPTEPVPASIETTASEPESSPVPEAVLEKSLPVQTRPVSHLDKDPLIQKALALFGGRIIEIRT